MQRPSDVILLFVNISGLRAAIHILSPACPVRYSFLYKVPGFICRLRRTFLFLYPSHPWNHVEMHMLTYMLMLHHRCNIVQCVIRRFSLDSFTPEQSSLRTSQHVVAQLQPHQAVRLTSTKWISVLYSTTHSSAHWSKTLLICSLLLHLLTARFLIAVLQFVNKKTKTVLRTKPNRTPPTDAETYTLYLISLLTEMCRYCCLHAPFQHGLWEDLKTSG